MAAEDLLRIEVVTSRQQFQDFFSLKRKIYRGDPSGVIPLRSMEFLQLDEDRHPFYQHASRQAFICYRNGEAVGRIVAIKDDLHNEYNQDLIGFFGFFETIDDQNVVDRLLETAAELASGKGLSSHARSR